MISHFFISVLFFVAIFLSCCSHVLGHFEVDLPVFHWRRGCSLGTRQYSFSWNNLFILQYLIVRL